MTALYIIAAIFGVPIAVLAIIALVILHAPGLPNPDTRLPHDGTEQQREGDGRVDHSQATRTEDVQDHA